MSQNRKLSYHPESQGGKYIEELDTELLIIVNTTCSSEHCDAMKCKGMTLIQAFVKQKQILINKESIYNLWLETMKWKFQRQEMQNIQSPKPIQKATKMDFSIELLKFQGLFHFLESHIRLSKYLYI